MIPHSPDAGNTPTPWTDEVRRQAWIAVRIAATGHAHERVLAYYLRSALAHGLTVDEVCYAGNLSPNTVRLLTRPAVL
jgi:hypothetical protein